MQDDRKRTGSGASISVSEDGVVLWHLFDRLFRLLFGTPQLAQQALRVLLPVEIAAYLDLDALPEILDPSIIRSSGKMDLPDIVVRVPLKGGHGYVRIVFEAKNEARKGALAQLLRYSMGTVVKQLDDPKRVEAGLEPVISVVFYTGSKQWRLPRRFDALFCESGELGATGCALDLPVRYLVSTPGNGNRDAMKRHPRVWAFMDVMSPSFSEDVKTDPAILERLLNAIDEDSFSHYLGSCALYRSDLDVEDLVAALERVEMAPERKRVMEENMGTWATNLILEGKTLGIAEGAANALLRVLSERFGRIPKKVEDRVNAAEPDTLMEWIGAAAKADKLDDVFAARA